MLCLNQFGYTSEDIMTFRLLVILIHKFYNHNSEAMLDYAITSEDHTHGENGVCMCDLGGIFGTTLSLYLCEYTEVA